MNSKSINQIQDEILEEFEPFDDWMDKYSLLIDMGNTLLPLEDSEKTPEHIIEGCQSRVWIVITPNEDGTLALRGDSDSHCQGDCGSTAPCVRWATTRGYCIAGAILYRQNGASRASFPHS